MTEEENLSAENGQKPDLGKFQSVEALMSAYRELEAEFTRRSQRLRALEAAPQQNAPAAPAAEAAPADGGLARGGEAGASAEDADALLRAVRGTEEVRARVVGEYLASLPSGVPLMAGTGRGVTAPVQRASTLKQAGAYALGYLRHQKQGG